MKLPPQNFKYTMLLTILIPYNTYLSIDSYVTMVFLLIYNPKIVFVLIY